MNKNNNKRSTLLLRRRLLDDKDASTPTLVTIEAAIEACAASIGEKKEFCVDDVMAIGDLELAKDPFYGPS